MTEAKKMMLVVGGEHDGAVVEVEDYTFAVRLPLPFTDEELKLLKEDKEPPIRFALYYRSTIHLQDDDGSQHQVEFLRTGKLSVRQAVEAKLLPHPNREEKLS